MSKWANAKIAVLETARKMVEKGLVIGTSGNVSLRLPTDDGRDLLAITPSFHYKDVLLPDEIQIIDFEGNPVEGDLLPSSETSLHISIYRQRENIKSVMHTHSIYASAIAVAHLEIPPILEDQVAIIGGEIKVAQYAPSGSEKLVLNAVEALEERNAVLLMNHGVIGIGRSIQEALATCELVEKTAKAYYLCMMLGKINLLSEEAIKSGKSFFKKIQDS